MKKKQKKVAIIGGGASGMVCAIVCAKAGAKVSIFEQNDTCGKKILISGNGACNITNTDVKKSDFYTQDSTLLESLLEHFSAKKMMQFLESLGIVLVAQEDGRVFPYSKDAKSVHQLLLYHLQKLGVKIHYNTKITSITKEKKINDTLYDVIVLANGSKAYAKLGGNESGYTLSQLLGHRIITPYPALVQLVTYEKDVALLQGVKRKATIKLFIDSAEIKTQQGDILFTSYGLSGLGILDLSIEAAKALKEGSYVSVEVDLLESFSIQQLSSFFATKKELTYSVALGMVVPKKVALYILKQKNIDKDATINQKQLKALLYELKHLRFGIADTKGFEYAEVCGGGVATNEIEPKTFRSKKAEGFYIIGELLDVVGKRGGYNFFFAFGSGALAGYDIIT